MPPLAHFTFPATPHTPRQLVAFVFLDGFISPADRTILGSEKCCLDAVVYLRLVYIDEHPKTQAKKREYKILSLGEWTRNGIEAFFRIGVRDVHISV
ncbi:hypothetical protein EJB05_38194, partial [Eragrostis curvula]